MLSAVLIARIVKEAPEFLRAVDLIAGTSTGAVLAMGLAAGLAPDQLVALYREHGRDVFADTALDNVRDVGNLIGAQYSAANFKRLLIQRFGDKRLRDLPVRVLVATFDLDNDAYDPTAFRTWKPKFFHNFPGPDSDGAERVAGETRFAPGETEAPALLAAELLDGAPLAIAEHFSGPQAPKG